MHTEEAIQGERRRLGRKEWWRQRASRETAAQMRRRGGEEQEAKEEVPVLPIPPQAEEDYDWDDLRPLPLDGQGKVLLKTDVSQGSGMEGHRRRRRGGRQRKFCTEARRKTRALENSTAEWEGWRGPRMAPPQENKVLHDRNVLPEIEKSEEHRRVPPMAPRQGNSSENERDRWRGPHMAPPQENK
eukprot:scaffold3989_cov70-Cyclotella_meneghiniana.AAC.5